MLMCEVNDMANTNKTIVMSAEVPDKMPKGTLNELVRVSRQQLIYGIYQMYSEGLEKFLNL